MAQITQMETQENAKRILLEITKELVLELHPHKRGILQVELSSSLDQDLGLDSLGRLELLRRLEDRFEIHFPDQTIGEMEQLKDLVNALSRALPKGRFSFQDQSPPKQEGEEPQQPSKATTLVEVLEWYAELCPQRNHLYFYPEEGCNPLRVTYGELLQKAREMAAGLMGLGVQAGDRIALMLPTGLEYFYSFFGILLSGAVPVPIYPPARPSQLEDHLKRHAKILENAETKVLITFPQVKMLSLYLKAKVEAMEYLLTPQELARPGQSPPEPKIKGSDIALLQYTSGSTGNPKGVVLTHNNLLANIRIMGRALEVSPKDVFLSWLPLYHDMGLIGAWLGSLYHACPLIIMPPFSFLLRPESWLWTIHHHRATISPSPNFGYELCLSKIKDKSLEGLDLSSWRAAMNGAEAVSPHTIERFSQRFASYGFKKEAMMPVYGLAEASLGLTFPPLERGPLIDRVQRDALVRQRRAIPIVMETKETMSFASSGRVLPGYELQIVDEGGNLLPERIEGLLEFKGPSVTEAYFNNNEANQGLFRKGWCQSGDLGYLADGELFVTGRVKDLIIRAGRNIYPNQLEEEIAEIDGIRKGCVAIIGARDPLGGTEKLVVVAETRETDKNEIARIIQEIEQHSFRLLELIPDEILVTPPHRVLKTTSGKIRRSAIKELYERGALEKGKAEDAWWIQVARLSMAGGRAQALSWMRKGGRLIYGAYAWSLFSALLPPVWGNMAMIPKQQARRKNIRTMAKVLIRSLGLQVEISGEENLSQASPCLLAANHCSYVDMIILSSFLPEEIFVVTKSEYEKNPFTRFFSQKYGVEFVERFDPKKASEDLDKLTHSLEQGRSLLIFPEGTFIRQQGLLPFHMGGFAAAAETNTPIIPIAIRGTRWILPDETWRPRRGEVQIVIGEPLKPKGKEWKDALELRDRTRKFILEHCGEPDRA